MQEESRTTHNQHTSHNQHIPHNQHTAHNDDEETSQYIQYNAFKPQINRDNHITSNDPNQVFSSQVVQPKDEHYYQQLLIKMKLDKQIEDELNNVQYQPYEDKQYCDISSILQNESHTAKLYLGNIFSATDKMILQHYNIKLVLSMINNIGEKINPDLFEQMNIENYVFPVDDSEQEDIEQFFEQICNLIDESLEKAESVLIHCKAGVSRSAALCMVYCMRKFKLSFKESYNIVHGQRPAIGPNRGFQRQMMAYSNQILGKKQKLIDKQQPGQQIVQQQPQQIVHQQIVQQQPQQVVHQQVVHQQPIMNNSRNQSQQSVTYDNNETNSNNHEQYQQYQSHYKEIVQDIQDQIKAKESQYIQQEMQMHIQMELLNRQKQEIQEQQKQLQQFIQETNHIRNESQITTNSTNEQPLQHHRVVQQHEVVHPHQISQQQHELVYPQQVVQQHELVHPHQISQQQHELLYPHQISQQQHEVIQAHQVIQPHQVIQQHEVVHPHQMIQQQELVHPHQIGQQDEMVHPQQMIQQHEIVHSQRNHQPQQIVVSQEPQPQIKQLTSPIRQSVRISGHQLSSPTREVVQVVRQPSHIHNQDNISQPQQLKNSYQNINSNIQDVKGQDQYQQIYRQPSYVNHKVSPISQRIPTVINTRTPVGNNPIPSPISQRVSAINQAVSPINQRQYNQVPISQLEQLSLNSHISSQQEQFNPIKQSVTSQIHPQEHHINQSVVHQFEQPHYQNYPVQQQQIHQIPQSSHIQQQQQQQILRLSSQNHHIQQQIQQVPQNHHVQQQQQIQHTPQNQYNHIDQYLKQNSKQNPQQINQSLVNNQQIQSQHFQQPQQMQSHQNQPQSQENQLRFSVFGQNNMKDKLSQQDYQQPRFGGNPSNQNSNSQFTQPMNNQQQQFQQPQSSQRNNEYRSIFADVGKKNNQ